jgi:hypothetical protein
LAKLQIVGDRTKKRRKKEKKRKRVNQQQKQQQQQLATITEGRKAKTSLN